MSVNTIYGYKLWDSLFGIESITWEFSTDINFENIILRDVTSGKELITTLPLLQNMYDTELYCRVLISGYNGDTDWFIVKEDKSNNIYITEGDAKYTEDIRHDKNIIKEIILDKDGNTIYDFDFKDTDEVIYLKEYDKKIDLDFLDTLKINTDWFYENISKTSYGIYRDAVYKTTNDYLILPIENRFDEKVTSNIYYICNTSLENNYLEIRANFMKLDNSFKYIYLKDIDGNTLVSITNIDNQISFTINDIEFTLPYEIEDTYYLLGIDGNGKIYLNHKVEIYSAINITDIYSIHMGNTFENNIMETGEFKLDYIRLYEDTLPDMSTVN